MTEWQKIVERGIVTEDFLKEERICELHQRRAADEVGEGFLDIHVFTS